MEVAELVPRRNWWLNEPQELKYCTIRSLELRYKRVLQFHRIVVVQKGSAYEIIAVPKKTLMALTRFTIDSLSNYKTLDSWIEVMQEEYFAHTPACLQLKSLSFDNMPALHKAIKVFCHQAYAYDEDTADLFVSYLKQNRKDLLL